MLRLHLAPVDIDHIAQGLEGIEGDAHRQQNLQRDRVQPDGKDPQQLHHTVREEIEVFEEKQQRQADAYGGHKNCFPRPRLLRLFQQDPGQIGNDGGRKNQHDIVRIPAHIKIAAGNQQQSPPVFVRQQPMENKYHRHEYRKAKGIEQQRQIPLSVI